MTTSVTAPALTRSAGLRHFGRHYAEMVVAMVLGMIVLAPAWSFVGGVLGWSAALQWPDAGAMVMATNMAVAMSAWMRYRGHGWARTAEMAAAMYLPFIILLVPLWAGAISGMALMGAGHVLMLFSMAAAMLWRRDEYTQPHRKNRH